MTIQFDHQEATTPTTPRWQVHVEIHGDSKAILRFRASLHDRLLSLQPWRAAIVTTEVGCVALTFSAFGQDYEDAMLDAKGVLHDFGTPSGAMTLQLSSPEQVEIQRSDLPILLGVKEVAELLGYSRQRISQLAQDHPESFPGPIMRVDATPLWLAEDILEWRTANWAQVERRLNRSAN